MLTLYSKGSSSFDLEAQVYEAQATHYVLAWKSRTWILWTLLAMLVLGWIHAYDSERRSLHAEMEMLTHRGPPVECYVTANDPEHPIPLAMHVRYFLHLDDPNHICLAYHTALERGSWPSPWIVTVKFFSDTLILPARHAMQVLTQAPWLVQVLLTLVLTITVIVYVTSRVSPIQRRHTD